MLSRPLKLAPAAIPSHIERLGQHPARIALVDHIATRAALTAGEMWAFVLSQYPVS